jgi:hypothetical protein
LLDLHKTLLLDLKMIKLILLSGTLLCAGMTSAYAEFVEVDWQEEGDNSALFDTSTGLAWLDLSETLGQSVLQMQEETVNPSSVYYGWRLPTQSELGTMFFNYFGVGDVEGSPTITYINTDSGKSALLSFVRYTGITFETVEGEYAYGYSLMDSGSGLLFSEIANKYGNKGYLRVNNLRQSADLSFSHESYGVFLVSDGAKDVPAPIALGALLLLGLGTLHRKK